MNMLQTSGALRQSSGKRERINIGKLSRRTQYDLDHVFGWDLLNPLTCEAVETFLVEKIRMAILDLISLDADQKQTDFRITDPANRSFEYENSIYSLEITDDLCGDGLKLVVSIRFTQRRHGEVRSKEFGASVDSAGRVTKIRARLVPDFEPLREEILEISKTILESGYRWLTENANRLIDIGQNGMATQLYSLLRRVIPEKQSQSIWLYALPKREGIYLLDPIARKIALNNALRRPISVRQSPLELLMLFSTTVINADRTFSQEAISTNQTIEREFAQAPYAASGVAIAESAIYFDKSLIVQPLIRDENNWLVAGYPTALRAHVEKTLNHERREFRRIIESRTPGIKGLIRQFTQPTFSRYLSDLAIGVTYEFCKHFFERPPGAP